MQCILRWRKWNSEYRRISLKALHLYSCFTVSGTPLDFSLCRHYGFVSYNALETYSSLINHTFEKWLFLVMNIYHWVLVYFLFIQYFLAKLLLHTRNFFRIRVMLKDACFQKKCKENLILTIDL